MRARPRRRWPEAAPRWPPAQSQLGVLRSQRQEEAARAAAGAGQSRARQERSRQHGHPRAGLRGRRQSRRAGRAIRQTRHRTAVAGAAAARLCHRQFQGDAADPDAAGAARRGLGRRLSRPPARPAGSTASRRRAAPSSACCRPTTPPAISPRSCSACRCGSPCRATARSPALLRPGLSVTVTVDTRDQGTVETGDGIVGAAEAKPATAEATREPACGAMTWALALPRAGVPAPRSGRARPGRAAKAGAAAAAASPARRAAAEPARLVRRARDGRRPVHGDHGRPDRDQLADPDPGRAVGQRRRDQLGADRIPDRRRRDGPAVRHAVAAVVDAGAVRHRGARLHRARARCARPRPASAR